MGADAEVSSSPVVVVGGGPAGSSTALTLRRHGVEVLLVEASDYRRPRVGESLPPDAGLVLRRLGVWRDFQGEGHLPCLGSSSVWGSDTPAHNDFLLNPHGHGWHLDRRRFDAFLAARAEGAGAVLRRRTRCLAVERRPGGGLALELDAHGERRRVETRFLVDATGSGARVARRLGARRVLHDRLTYVGAFLEAPAGPPLARRTWLEAVPYGWWYGASLPDGKVAVAVAGDPEEVRSRALHRPATWRAHLDETRYVGEVLAGCRGPRIPGEMLVRAAPSSVLEPAAGPGWLAVGDAAAAHDPISSQGIYRALEGGLRAGEAVAAHLRGDDRLLAAHDDGVRERFAEYLGVRDHLYDLERRWRDARFWERRRDRAWDITRSRDS